MSKFSYNYTKLDSIGLTKSNIDADQLEYTVDAVLGQFKAILDRQCKVDPNFARKLQEIQVLKRLSKESA